MEITWQFSVNSVTPRSGVFHKQSKNVVPVRCCFTAPASCHREGETSNCGFGISGLFRELCATKRILREGVLNIKSNNDK